MYPMTSLPPVPHIPRIIYSNRTYPNSQSLPGPRFITAGMLAMGAALLMIVLAVVQLGHGQDTKPNTPAKAQTPATTPAPAPTPATATPAPAPTPAPADTPPVPSVSTDACNQCKGKYCPALIQCKDLAIAQKDAIIGNQAYSIRLAQEEVKWDEYAKKQYYIQTLISACRKIIDDNKWPADVRCDPNTVPIVFVGKDDKAAAQAPAPAPAVTPGPAATTPPAIPPATPKPTGPVKKPRVKNDGHH